MSLDASPSTPTVFRDCLREALPAEVSLDAVLVVASELVTNAVLHGEPPIDARVGYLNGITRVEVADRRPDMGAPTAESRGLELIEEFASTWGVEPLSQAGKIVWAEVRSRHQY